MPSKKRVGLLLSSTGPFLTLKAAKAYLQNNGILGYLPEPGKVRNWNDVYLTLERLGLHPSTFLIRDKQHFKSNRRKFLVLYKAACPLLGQKKREEKKKARIEARRSRLNSDTFISDLDDIVYRYRTPVRAPGVMGTTSSPLQRPAETPMHPNVAFYDPNATRVLNQQFQGYQYTPAPGGLMPVEESPSSDYIAYGTSSDGQYHPVPVPDPGPELGNRLGNALQQGMITDEAADSYDPMADYDPDEESI